MRLFRRLAYWHAAVAFLFCGLPIPACAAVVINELMAASSERQLSWSSNGVPCLGSGVAWMEPDFVANGWPSGNLPAGYGFGGLATDLSFSMSNKAPSLYLRKEFNVTPDQAALTDALSLLVDYDDGFVAYLNGREVFRANCGATNRFMFARQPAFNVTTNNGLAQFDLGSVSAALVPGRNVLAIQAHNAEQPSTPSQPGQIIQHIPTPQFKINAGLGTDGAVVVLRAASFDFNDAAGGAKRHANTNGVITDTTTGMLAPNGWLATSANPTSAPMWQALEIVAAELPGLGFLGSGALRYTINQSGTSQSAEMHAPAVDMTGGWVPGAAGVAGLTGTRLRFRYRITGDAQFGLRFDPALGQEANGLSGFPIIRIVSQPPITFSNATNGARVMTIDANGVQTQSRSGILRSAIFAQASSDVRSMIFRIVEDATEGGGYNSSTGHLRAEITQAASAGASWGFGYYGVTPNNWAAGNVTTQDFAYTTFQFACKIPAGVTFQVWAEPGTGGFSNRVDWGMVTGDDTWQLVQRDFATAPGAENFRAALNAARLRAFTLVFQGSASLGVGTWIQLDDFQIVPWARYDVRLGDGTNGQSAFLSYLNANNSVSFIPTFAKLTDTPLGGQTLTIDDYELVYFGTNAANGTTFIPSGPAGDAWTYFIGRAEPSGGVFDPGLLTNNFVPPAGEENDFEEPANFVDWVELFNEGAAPVNLSGWSLTDERDTPAKWRFPTNTILPSDGYLLVLCDGREEANAPAGPATYLHAGFKLSSDGEYLALFDQNGVFVDGLTGGYPRQVFFCSYGRNPTNRTQFGFLGTATPGTNNLGPFYPARVDAPEFKRGDGTNDLPGGLYSEPSLTLLLTNDTPNSIIRYTLNGSEPAEWNGALYTAPLTLTQPTDKTGIVVRARAFLHGWLPSGVKTHTYLLRQPSALTNVPTMLFTGQKERAFYKPFGVLAINGGVYQPANGGEGEIWVANGPQSYDEVLGNGPPFEREVHMEYYFPPGYYPTNQQPIREDVGLRVSSSPYQRPRMRLANVEVASPWPPLNNLEKPSFNIYFNGDYGIAKLDYRLFPNYDVKEFQHLRLRAGKNDNGNPFITDELVRRLWHDMGHVGARGLFCSLYLNAVYKGVFNLTERMREPLFQAHYRSSLDWDVRYNYDWVNGDGIAYNNMSNALNADLGLLANWQAAAALLDVDNFADYYLLNIYCAMGDWPDNNFVFARERSTGPLSKFIYSVWDAEAAFNINPSFQNKPVSYTTILTDLQLKNTDVPNIWKRLVTSPEFKLRFADRINRHLFNGGVLDDRDPDGAGPMKSHFQQRFDELAGEAAPLVLYNQGSPLRTNVFTTWTASGTGRRSYLLGNNTQQFRNAGLWPVTEPPVFSQFGGAVPMGYGLSMTSTVAVTGQTATIYYALDDVDPRQLGGALSASSLTYTGAVTLTNIVTVKARAKNDATGEWSPLTEATFAPSSVPASSNNLVIAEMMYHPPDATAAELTAGFNNADDFEFIRLQNIDATSVDLSNVRFAVGITFDFGVGSVRYIKSGGNVLVVKNRTAFRLRYGNSLDGRIAGEYAGNLSNGGERLQLLSGTNTVIRDFTYSDGGAWPDSPDGDGPSLLLRAPFSNPDHAQPTNWMASAIPGGLPGGTAPPLSYEAWRALLWGPNAVTNNAISGPAADPDGDRLPNFVEYALGLHPKRVQLNKKPFATIETTGDAHYLALQYTVSSSAIEATVTLQVSSNLVDWLTGPPNTELLLVTPNLDGTTTYQSLDTAPLETTPYHFMRLRVTNP